METFPQYKTLLTCWICDGEGYFNDFQCPDCLGTGFYQEPEKSYPFHGYGLQLMVEEFSLWSQGKSFCAYCDKTKGYCKCNEFPKVTL